MLTMPPLTKKEKILLSNDFKEIIHSDLVEVIVDATGVPEVGAKFP